MPLLVRVRRPALRIPREHGAARPPGGSEVPGLWAAGAGTSLHTAGDGARVAIHPISAIQGERHVDHDRRLPSL